MSDDMRFLLLVTEGPHDVEAIARIFRIRGFRELTNKQDVPDELKGTIPQKYPFNEEGFMDRGVPRPSYVMKDHLCVAIINAGGISRIEKDWLR